MDDLLSGKFLQPGRRTNKRSMEFVKSKSKTSSLLSVHHLTQLVAVNLQTAVSDT